MDDALGDRQGRAAARGQHLHRLRDDLPAQPNQGAALGQHVRDAVAVGLRADDRRAEVPSGSRLVWSRTRTVPFSA